MTVVMVVLAVAAVWIVVKIRGLDRAEAARAGPGSVRARLPGATHYCVCPRHDPCECPRKAVDR